MQVERRSVEDGFGTAYSLVLIFFITAIILAIILLFKNSDRVELDSALLQFEQTSQEAVNKVIESLLNDETPEADSPSDLIWKRLPEIEAENQVKISLNDVSSRINPNFFRNEIIEETGLNSLLFKDGHTMTELEQERHDNGLSSRFEYSYPDFFTEEALEKYLTTYSYLNINIADEQSIADFYTERTGDSTNAEAIHSKVRDVRTKKEIISNDQMNNFLGSDYKLLYPVICSVPVMNLHYIPEEILKNILNHSFGSKPLPRPEYSLGNFISGRANREYTPDELKNIFGIEKIDHPIYDYIGVKTWFWELSIETENYMREIILAEIPNPEISYRPDGGGQIDNSRRIIQIVKNIVSEKDQ